MNYRRHIPSRRRQTNEVSALSESITARITLLEGSIIGFRGNRFARRSILRVRAAPFAELDKTTQWWRLTPATAFDVVALREMRASLLKIDMLGEPRWKDATTGDAPAAIHIAHST